MYLIKASWLAPHIVYWFSSKKQQIDNLKLQKLLYYTQAWHLAIFGTPILAEQIEAWVHGPVIPDVFRLYRDCRWNSIPATVPSGHLPPGLGKHVTEVLKAYGDFTGWQLERLTHSERPWQEARGGLPPDAPSHNIITHQSMKEYYRARMNG
jgi:uncharacterized phage-associated protein